MPNQRQKSSIRAVPPYNESRAISARSDASIRRLCAISPPKSSACSDQGAKTPPQSAPCLRPPSSLLFRIRAYPSASYSIRIYEDRIRDCEFCCAGCLIARILDQGAPVTANEWKQVPCPTLTRSSASRPFSPAPACPAPPCIEKSQRGLSRLR